MATNSALWQDIYDPGSNEDHLHCRWNSDLGGRVPRSAHWAQYEPYGQKTQEKEDFINSINSEHPLWSSIYHGPISRVGISFTPETEVAIVDERVLKRLSNEDLDQHDREKKASYVFSHMLCEYVEKHKMNERKNFFNSEKTMKWTKDEDLMKRLGPLFTRTNRELEESPNKKLALCETTVKDYPRHYFFEICDLYLDHSESQTKRKKISKLNVNAAVFVPMTFSVGPCTTRPLVRQAPRMICGAYLIEKPSKPAGAPFKKRPKSDASNSTSKLCWQMKGETDNKIENLENKLDFLIQLNQVPVVQAEKII